MHNSTKAFCKLLRSHFLALERKGHLFLVLTYYTKPLQRDSCSELHKLHLGVPNLIFNSFACLQIQIEKNWTLWKKPLFQRNLEHHCEFSSAISRNPSFVRLVCFYCFLVHLKLVRIKFEFSLQKFQNYVGWTLTWLEAFVNKTLVSSLNKFLIILLLLTDVRPSISAQTGMATSGMVFFIIFTYIGTSRRSFFKNCFEITLCSCESISLCYLDYAWGSFNVQKPSRCHFIYLPRLCAAKTLHF